MKKHNFSAGPAILLPSILEEASKAVIDYNGIGLSILEISHRSPEFVDVLERAKAAVVQLLQLSDDYAVLFLTGGASSQFYMSALNLLPPSAKAAYVDTGSWSSKAIKEAKNFGGIEIIASSKDQNYNYIPKGYDIPKDTSFLHLTSNNTIFGTQYHSFPTTDIPIVCDMSSDIFSKPIEMERFGLIYAGAQKNIGPAGTTLVIVRKDLLGKVDRNIPTMLNYQTHIDKGSSFNTPPVYPIYVSMLTLERIVEYGGLGPMQDKNERKGKLIYDAIDASPLFTGNAQVEDRSLMNVTFNLKDQSLKQAFLDACDEAEISGIKGHRSAGGFRASIYNAMPFESAQVLVDVMNDFSQKHG